MGRRFCGAGHLLQPLFERELNQALLNKHPYITVLAARKPGVIWGSDDALLQKNTIGQMHLADYVPVQLQRGGVAAPRIFNTLARGRLAFEIPAAMIGYGDTTND